MEIDTKGGTVRNLDLVKYPHDKENTIVNNMYSLVGLKPDEKDLSPIRLLDSKVENLFLAQSGLMTSPGSSKAPDHHTVFSTEKKTYELGVGEDIISVPFVWTDNKGLVVTKTFTFKRGSYDINVDQKIQNNSSNTWSGRQYGQLLRAPYVDDKGNTFIRTFAGGVVYTEEDKYQKIDYDEMQDENLNVATLGGWSAMIQHYFATAWIPPKDQQNHFYTKELKDWRYVIGSYSPEVTVQPRTEIVLNSHLFSGPKIQPMMENIATGLELTVDYGWLTIFGKKIYWLLNKIHDYVGNWGWSILGVTLCIKLLFFPLTQASYRSMAKMRKIQPRLKDLKEKFADDRQRFNTEMMAMYKKEKVNPMGGVCPCWFKSPYLYPCTGY